MDSARSRKVLMGTCGWSDYSLQRCGRFYPASVRTAEDRLRHYSVEVDTSTYAIPSSVSINRWINAVIPGFLFHFKAFGLFCSKGGNITTIPNKIRSKLPPSDEQFVKLYDLPTDIRDELWDIFNSVLQPVYQAGCLGVVIFQFHLSFKPSEENQAHVMWCRKNLDARFSMAVEFRCREWFAGEQKSKTERWLASNSLPLIASDELKHETFQKDREQTGLAPGRVREVLPIAWPSTTQDFLYIRIHRREGTERLLLDEELHSWEKRLASQLPSGLQGPIYFMWGTDWEDQPLINAKRLSQRLPKELVYDWKLFQKGSNRLQSMFKAAVSKVRHPDSDQYKAQAQHSSHLQPTKDLKGSHEGNNKGPCVDNLSLEEEESYVKCPSFNESVDKSISCSPLYENNELQQELAIKRKLEDVATCENVLADEDVAYEKSPAQVASPDVSMFVKSHLGKLAESLPEAKMTKKAIQTKKIRTANSTPTITSFFKRATARDL